MSDNKQIANEAIELIKQARLKINLLDETECTRKEESKAAEAIRSLNEAETDLQEFNN